MFVLTIDQQASRTVGDRVEALLDDLQAWAPERDALLVRPFERTVGDEVQGVLDDPDLVVDLALRLVRTGGWSVGIGLGAVDEPLPASTRAGSGPAFVHARAAVERAKTRTRPVPLAVEGAVGSRAADAEAVLTLIGALTIRRSTAGWAVVDALTADGGPGTQDAVAARLGITQQAVSQRLRTAMWAEEVAARPVVARLLQEGDA